VLSRPSFITDDAIATAVAAHWLPEAAEADYLPWGFGAHHWRVAGGGMVLFVTLDEVAPRHTPASLEAAYAGAAALAAGGLDIVCAPLPARSSGRFTIDIGPGALSVTPWLDGRSPSEEAAREPRHVRQVVAALAALHRAEPPDGVPSWAPRVGPAFADELREHTARPWTSGPLAEQARGALAAHHDAITRWTSRYLELADIACARRETWVPTHGEPHNDNQVTSAGGELKLVDWESLALAPRERDYADLLDTEAGDGLDPDPTMVELFALDWRLSELDEYARWFVAPHTGTDDDHTALEGLYEELEEPSDT
jgi:spectinomycin phosphotransferase